jgi:UbiA prenyltransferase family
MTNGPHKPGRLLGLVRPEVLLALVSALWLMTFLGHYIEPETRGNASLVGLGLWGALGLSAVIAVGLGLFMMALNDALDARHDRAFEPDRPIPSGRVTQRAAFGLAMAGLLAALAAAVAFGPLSIILALVAAGAIVFYNFAGRFVPAVGIITLGLVIGITALIPNPRLAFAWPILLMMTHTIAAATVRHWLAGKRPVLTPVNGWGILVGWVFWSLVVLMLIRVRDEGIEHEGVGLIWIGPTIAAAVFSLITWLILGPSTLAPSARRGTAARFTKLTTVWLIVFNASWLMSAGLWWQGLIVLSLLAFGLLSMGAVQKPASQSSQSGPA